MKVLVYGAGVIGGQIAHALCISGNEVTILARGAWAETLRRTGLRIHHYIQRTDTTDWPHVIEKLDNKAYDAVFAVMQYRQMEKILPDLAAVNSPIVVLTGNTLSAGEMEAMILKNTTVPKTVLFGFGYVFIMFLYSGELAVWGILLLLVSVILIMPLLYRQRSFTRRMLDTKGALSAMAFQLIRGIERLKLSGAEDKALERYLTPYTEMRKHQTGVTRSAQLTTVLQMMFSFCKLHP